MSDSPGEQTLGMTTKMFNRMMTRRFRMSRRLSVWNGNVLDTLKNDFSGIVVVDDQLRAESVILLTAYKRQIVLKASRMMFHWKTISYCWKNTRRNQFEAFHGKKNEDWRIVKKNGEGNVDEQEPSHLK
ncbi:unnamed protein product [Caenorhabditis nigoni]